MAAFSNVLKYDALLLAIAAGDTIKVAFYAAAASIDATTPAYTATNEVTQGGATPAINAGGVALSGIARSASDGSAATSTVNWSNLQITPNATFQFQKLLIYNASRSNRALWSHDYGSVQTWNSGTQYTLTMPGSGGLVQVG